MPGISLQPAAVGLGLERRVEARDGAEETYRVGVQRTREQLGHRDALDHPAGIHHDHPLRHLRHDAHVVGDQDDRGADPLLQLVHEVQDLRLDGDVERRGGLVGDQQARVAGHGHRDHHPLAQPARELEGILFRAPRGLGDANELERRHGRRQRVLARQALMGLDRLGDLAADGHHRIERGHRLLKDHRDGVAANAPQLGFRERRQIAALEPDLARLALRRRRGQKAQDRQRRDGLAAARFADHGQRLAAIHLERDAVDRVDDPFGGVKADAQVVDPEHDVALRAARDVRPPAHLDLDGGSPPATQVRQRCSAVD